MSNSFKYLLRDATTTVVGEAITIFRDQKAFQAYGLTSVGVGEVTVNIDVSVDGVRWVTAGTITLSLTTSEVSDGFIMNANWNYVRAEITTLVGVGANINVIMSN